MSMLPGIAGANAIPENTGSDFSRLPAGGYVCEILNVKVEQTKSGQMFIKLQIDIKEGEYAAYYTKLWNSQKNSQFERKWKGMYKIFLPVNNGDESKYKRSIAFYKGQVNAIARSNGMPEINIETGYDPDIFKHKLVGVLFRDTQYDVEGKQGFYTEAAFLTTVEKIRSGDFKIPEPKLLSTSNNIFQSSNTSNNTLDNGIWGAARASMQQNANSSSNTNNQNIGDLSDFEGIISDGDVPF